jgi:alpha-beta hydrolase superfamily lysophospholipase
MQKSVSFYSGPGLKLAGNLYIGDDYRDGKRPAVVLCGGFMGTKEIILPNIANWLIKTGYIVLTFDFRGFGESEGPEARLIPLEQVQDIRNAITFVQQQPQVDAHRIGLFGASFGASTAIYAAAMDKRVKCVVSILGVGDGRCLLRSLRRAWEWADFLKRVEEDSITRVMTGKSQYVDREEVMVPDPETEQFHAEQKKNKTEGKTKLPLESVEAILDFQPESVVDRISPRAALFIFAGADTLAPPDETRGIAMYEKAGDPKKLVILEGVYHHAAYHSPVIEQVMGISTEWLNTYLRETTVKRQGD